MESKFHNWSVQSDKYLCHSTVIKVNTIWHDQGFFSAFYLDVSPEINTNVMRTMMTLIRLTVCAAQADLNYLICNIHEVHFH